MSYTATVIRLGYTATLTELSRYVASVTQRIIEDMGNYILNRYDVTGLVGGTPTKLDAIPAGTLATLPNGARAVITLTHADGERIRAEYELGARDAAAEVVPWLIACDAEPARCWRLDRGSVFKGGLPCAYNGGTGKFHRVWAVGADGSATAAVDETGFTLPA